MRYSLSAQIELIQYLNPNSQADRINRLDKLPAYIANIGQKLINFDNLIQWRYQSELCEINYINKICVEDRQILFSALYPGITTEVDSAYEYINELSKLPGSEIPYVARNTNWLCYFTENIRGFEDRDLNWFIENERYFDLRYILSALISRGDNTGNQILKKVLSFPLPETKPNSNRFNTFLCTPLDIGKIYLEQNLDQYNDKVIDVFENFYDLDPIPVHPQAISHAYNYAEEKKYTKLCKELAYSIHLGQNSKVSDRIDVKTVIKYITRPDLVRQAIKSGGDINIFYALYATAYQDQKLAVNYIDQVLNEGKPQQLNGAGKVLTLLNDEDVLPLVLRCMREANPIILKKLYASENLFSSYDSQKYFDSSLISYHDELVKSDLFESMKQVFVSMPDIIENPGHEFIKYLGDRSFKSLDFLGELDNYDLYDLYYQVLPNRVKDQDTTDFIVNTLSSKHHGRDFKYFTLDHGYMGYLGSFILVKSLDYLREVDLTIDQLLQIIGICHNDSEELESHYLDFLLTRKDETLQELLAKACSSRKKLHRLHAMRLIVELKKVNRLTSSIPELISILHSNTKLSEDEEYFLNTVLDRKPGNVNYEDLLEQPVVSGAKNLCIMLYSLHHVQHPFLKGLLSNLEQKINESVPLPDDTPELFAKLVAEFQISKNDLVWLAFFAPQWKPYVTHIFGKRFFDAVDWLNVIRNYLFDTRKIYEFLSDLGEELWGLSIIASMYSRVYTGNYRGRLSAWTLRALKIYTQAVSGKTNLEEMIQKFNVMDPVSPARARAYIVAIGLLPLLAEPDRIKQIIQRFQFIKDYILQSKKYYPGKRHLNLQAASIALENLAWNADYSDLQTFELAMETEAVKDLAAGPVITIIDEYKLKLSLTDQGGPGLEIRKDGKLIKSIPEKLKNHQDFVALKERVKQIRREATRLRGLLEEAMSTSKEYTTAEFLGLMGHPILKSMMRKLIFISKNGMGYPVSTILRLSSYDGNEFSINEDDHLRIAHPYDLMQSGQWDKWQHECFTSGRIQPFKQVFRELYLVTDAEKNEDHESQQIFWTASRSPPINCSL